MKEELRQRGHEVFLPAMPHPDYPVIAEWIGFIAKLVGEPDEGTALVGHSIGCQGVLRYLETLGVAGKAVAKTVLVAGSFPLGMSAAEAKKAAGADAALEPWFRTGVDPVRVKKAAGKCTVILSDDDPYLDIPKVKAAFRAALDPKIIIEPGQGHFNEDDHVEALPSALTAVLGEDMLMSPSE